MDEISMTVSYDDKVDQLSCCPDGTFRLRRILPEAEQCEKSLTAEQARCWMLEHDLVGWSEEMDAILNLT